LKKFFIASFLQRAEDRWFRKKFQMQGPQNMRGEAHLRVRGNDEVAAQQLDFLRDHQNFYKNHRQFAKFL